MNIINNNRPIIIGIDHGFGNVKTAHTCFRTGVTTHDKEPTFKSDLLIYQGRYYTIGDEHKEFIPDKALDQDYYILTLAAIARELRFRGVTTARIFLAAGLPLTWVSEQKDTSRRTCSKSPKWSSLFGAWSITLTSPGQQFTRRAFRLLRIGSMTFAAPPYSATLATAP